jgi:hypothetical protein
MQQNQPKLPPITYFVVQPHVFQKVVNKLSELPYNAVSNVLQDLIGTSRAMFGEPPITAKFRGPGGQVVTDQPGNGDVKEPGAPVDGLDLDDKETGQSEDGSAES